ncbi:pilus assembly protein TadG-related protein [Nocardioides dongxiaopingii]|uniref:pilus assembly protein TadG-related protein n=1 Tax=Nocardioides dongxiaopingii TaxID=2576036 RepID=UPI001FE75F59|nr:pilus assembly protein TadG-related protein [Nocardioides dongxiaopingii]
MRRRSSQRGSVSPLVVGFAVVLLMLVAVVVDASQAFLRRQSLATLAEGAALRAADLGAEGREVYTGGLGDDPLALTSGRARAAVGDYLADVGAYGEHPGLRYDVRVAGDRVEVSLTARVELPLTFPGTDGHASVTGTGAAIADPE